MAGDKSTQDALEFMRGLWSKMSVPIPGMMTPTLDPDELQKRIADMKAVEGWLKMNLNMLQMTIQGLELQLATLIAMKNMNRQQRDDESDAPLMGMPNPFMMWPWNLATGKAEAEEPSPDNPEPEPEKPSPQPPKTPRGRGSRKS